MPIVKHCGRIGRRVPQDELFRHRRGQAAAGVRMLMTCLLFRVFHADVPHHCLAIAAILIAVLALPTDTVPAVAAGPTDPAAGPAGWTDDLSTIGAADCSDQRAAH